ncbi:MAG: cupin domain-containing protein [Chloroflexota bacterium]|nr:cupin domain-containing protein [Chloroflexota bacterium]
MQIIEIARLRPPGGGSPQFQGIDYGANTSFFVVNSLPSQGADKHRHPYEEIFVILDGDIEVIVDGERQMVGGGTIVIIPAESWHAFKNRSDHPALMVNIHPVSKMIQEDWTER